ncbi:MAG: D-sedoheptulose 7-phosphate isomerase [Candidatus Goldbacteria bacterium]|nr:D-sedoheptulose 7-phosphate isomerase [Candidatus Goldiibacteriota bacterium]
MSDYFRESIDESCRIKKESFDAHKSNLFKIADEIFNTLLKGKKILLIGNGGSAADAQHIAAEFVVRLKKERKAYPAIALTTDTSVLTSCGNDYGYENVFKRQIEALGEKGDILIALSTSGNSKNVIEGIKEARKRKIKIIGFTGDGGGKMKGLCDILIDVKSDNTMRIQETHITFLHIISDIVEKKLLKEKIK